MDFCCRSRLEANPKPHLAEVARETLAGPATGKISVHKGQFAVGAPNGDVMLFDGARFNPVGKRSIDPPASGPAYFTDAGVLVESGDSNLVCLNPDIELTDKWKIEAQSSLAGQPQVIGANLF